jgi:hypothetical protein
VAYRDHGWAASSAWRLRLMLGTVRANSPFAFDYEKHILSGVLCLTVANTVISTGYLFDSLGDSYSPLGVRRCEMG